MTTLTIDRSSVGLTLVTNGTLTALRYVTAGTIPGEKLILVDDANLDTSGMYNSVARQLYCGDLLDMSTGIPNANPNNLFGVMLKAGGNVTVPFGNLTVVSVPTNAVFSADVTGTVASASALEGQRRALAQRNKLPEPPEPPPPNYVSPKDYVEQPPPPPDPILVAAEKEAQVRWNEQREWRAKHGGIVGPSLEQIRTELLVAAQRRRAEEAAAAEANAAMFQKAEAIRVAREAAQAEATALLKAQRKG
jgi:hypothetical protein